MAARKVFGTTWWGRAWLNALQAIDHANRLPRGRTYWNSGRIEQLGFASDGSGRIEALVQGNAYYPYEVSVAMAPLPAAAIKRLVDRVARDPNLISALLAGELPEGIARAAETLGIDLFPKTYRSLAVSCSCPDSARICKHVAAVIYGMVDLIDRDPFLVFRLRGIDLVEELRRRGIDLAAARRTRAPSIFRYLQNALEGAPDPKFEGNAYTALDTLRTLPLSGVEPALEKILALWPERHPLSNVPNFRSWWRTVHKKIARSLETRLTKGFVVRFEEGAEDVDDTLRSRKGLGTLMTLLERHPAYPGGDDGALRLKLVLSGDRATLEARASTDGQSWYPIDRRDLVEQLIDFDDETAKTLPVEIDALRSLVVAATKLVLQGALVPVLAAAESNIEIEDGISEPVPVFYWAPALRSGDVAALFEAAVTPLVPLVETLFDPNTLQDFEADSEENAEDSDSQRTEPRSGTTRKAALLALAWASTALVAREAERLHITPEDIAQAYLLGVDLREVAVPDPQAVDTLCSRYFRPFLMADAFPWRPVLTVRSGAEDVTVNFGILPRESRTPVRLSVLLRDAQWASERFAALEVLKTLERVAPEIASIRTTSGDPAHIALEDLKPFLFEAAPLLRLLGVVLRLPESLRKMLKPRLVARFGDADERAGASGLLGKEALAEFEWRVAVGDDLLTLEDLRRLMRDSGGIVKWKDDYVYLDPAELERIARTLEAEREPSYLEKMRGLLTGEMEGAEVVASPAILKRLETLTAVETIEPPKSLRAQLRPYQERGYAWLVKNLKLGLGSLIADDMGLGKTLQVIAALTYLKESGELAKEKALVVLPTTLITNWTRELAKFSPELTVGVYHGADRTLPAANVLPDVTLTSYGLLRRDAEVLGARRWRLLVLDEAQAVKNTSSAQTAAVKQLKARQVLAMSGTPVENRLSEYWSIFSTVQPRLLGTLKDFRETFARPIEADHDPKAAAALKRLTAPFMLRRLKSDKSIIADLPEKNVVDYFTNLTPEQAALYAQTLERLMGELAALEASGTAAGADSNDESANDSGAEPKEILSSESGSVSSDIRAKRRGLVLRLITALKQICNSPSQYLKTDEPRPDSGKAAALLELLDRCRDADRKVLVFTQFREMGERLQNWIEAATGERPDFLHGGVNLKERSAMVDRFQTDRSVRVLIVSLKAGGTGLNLTAASAVVHYDLWWNPAVENQATDRAYRIGQRRDVLVYRFVTAGTFEEKINAMLMQKRELADLTVSTGEAWIGDMKKEEIEAIFRLSPETER